MEAGSRQRRASARDAPILPCFDRPPLVAFSASAMFPPYLETSLGAGFGSISRRGESSVRVPLCIDSCTQAAEIGPSVCTPSAELPITPREDLATVTYARRKKKVAAAIDRKRPMQRDGLTHSAPRRFVLSNNIPAHIHVDVQTRRVPFGQPSTILPSQN